MIEQPVLVIDSMVARALEEDALVGQVHHDAALPRADAASLEHVLPVVADGDHVRREPARPALLPPDHALQQSMTIVSEPSAEELGHEVVQVEDDGNALDPRNDGAEDEEVRKVVDLDRAVAMMPMKRCQPHGCQDEEPQVAQELAREARLGESHGEAMDLDALVHGVLWDPLLRGCR